MDQVNGETKNQCVVKSTGCGLCGWVWLSVARFKGAQRLFLALFFQETGKLFVFLDGVMNEPVRQEVENILDLSC